MDGKTFFFLLIFRRISERSGKREAGRKYRKKGSAKVM